MTTRDRIANRILAEMRKDRTSPHDRTTRMILSAKAEAAADAVLDELGWNDAVEVTVAKDPASTATSEDADRVVAWMVEHVGYGTFRVIREEPE